MTDTQGHPTPTSVDVVIIGLNVAGTLHDCLRSVLDADRSGIDLRIFYVDGGSSDNSRELAGALEQVTVLCPAMTHTAPGLQRNLGFRAGQAEFVQFLDADTTMHQAWLQTALQAFTPDCAAVCGLRTERHPNASIYNWLADQEWNGPAGICDAFGGDVMIRRAALEQVDGYAPDLIAGEDPELSRRICASGWTIRRVHAPMTTHDIAMTSARQWFRRAFRTGYGYAAVSARLQPGDKFWKTEMRRILIRGGGFLVGMCGAMFTLIPGFPVPAAAFFLTGLLALLYPRIFRRQAFADALKLQPDEATRYAWHCSLVVVPELLGIFRYVIGHLTGRPLRNAARPVITALLPMLFLLVTACTGLSPQVTPANENATMPTAGKTIKAMYASPEAVEQFSQSVPAVYQLGPGDVVTIQVWNRPEISAKDLIISPDGNMSVNRIGHIHVQGLTVPQATDVIRDRLSHFYEHPEVTLVVTKYINNKVFVLGRVTSPGVVYFPDQGNLLEALALAGGLPVLQTDAFLTRCSIIRGKNTIIWIDLRDLLENGNMGLNARLQNNDIVFIPESEDELVYIMGEIKTPGAIRLKARLSILDALMLSGGPTTAADLNKTYLIRFDGEKGHVTQINVANMLETGMMTQNYLLQAGDVLYVAPSTFSDINFALTKLMPSMMVFDLGTSVLERFGVMPDLRGKLYPGQGSSSSGTTTVISP